MKSFEKSICVSLMIAFALLGSAIITPVQAQQKASAGGNPGAAFIEGNWRQFVGGRIWECSHYRFQVKGDVIEVIAVIDKIDGFCRANRVSGFNVGDEKLYATLKLEDRRLVGKMFDGTPSEWELTNDKDEIKWKNPDEQFAAFMPYYIYRRDK